MSNFNSGAIDPALLSSSGTTTLHGIAAISPAQLVNSSRSPSAQNFPSASLAAHAHAPPTSLSSGLSAPIPPPVPGHNPFSSSSSLSSSAHGAGAGAAFSSQPFTSNFINGAVNQPTNAGQPVSSDPFMANGMSLKEHEMHQKDQELAQFLLKMDDYKPVIPDEVASYYLERVGFASNDVKLKRLLILACQKFISDIAEDAFSYASTRAGQAPGGRSGQLVPGSNSAGVNSSGRRDRTRAVLTQEDLTQALAEYGINASRAPYYL